MIRSSFLKTEPFTTGNHSPVISRPLLFHWRLESDFGLPRAVGTKRSMLAFTSAAMFPLGLLSRLMLVDQRNTHDEADPRQVIVEQHKFYNQDVPIIYQLLLIISTQVLGYAFAGLTRRFLVRPSAMIWPGTLMSTAMFSTMHKSVNKKANGWSISRYKFFVVVWAGAFLWYFVPGLLMPALSYFNVITWLAPKNVVISNLVRHSGPLFKLL